MSMRGIIDVYMRHRLDVYLTSTRLTRHAINIHSTYIPNADLTYTSKRLGRILSPFPFLSHLPLFSLLPLVPPSHRPCLAASLLSTLTPCLPPSLPSILPPFILPSLPCTLSPTSKRYIKVSIFNNNFRQVFHDSDK